MGRLLPGLFALTSLSALAEVAIAISVAAPALAATGAMTGMFAVVISVADRQIRAGQSSSARLVIAIGVAALGVVGAYAIPGVGPATSFLPALSVALLLPHVPRSRILLLIGSAVATSVAILILDEVPHPIPAITGAAETIFQGAILIVVLVLVLAGLVDFAMEARSSLANLEASMKREMRAGLERREIIASLRNLQRESNPEATAATMSQALVDLPFVDVAAVLEVTGDGLSLLALATELAFPYKVGDILSPVRSAQIIARSKMGAWAELGADRAATAKGGDRLERFGIEGQAFAPVLAGDEMIGLIGIITTDHLVARHVVTDLPAVREFASLARTILAPALLDRRQLSLARDVIADTIASGGFHAFFQPIVDLRTSRTVGYEALTRFASGTNPQETFAAAARAGLAAELETATLALALHESEMLPTGAFLSLNVSPWMLAEHDTLARLFRHRTRPLVLEVTEHEIIDDYAPLHAAIRRFGPDVRLAVDDAGAGVANFTHLVELRPDFVKIDIGLIRGLNLDVPRQAVVVGLVHFAAAAGALVIAEGIENDAERATAQRLGVTLGQGYGLARPERISIWAEPDPAMLALEPGGQVIPMRKRRSSG